MIGDGEPPTVRWRHRLWAGGYELRYASQIADWEVPRFRRVHAGLFYNGHYVGYFRIGAYRPRRPVCTDHIITDLDAISTDSAEFGTVLTDSWNELDLLMLADAGHWFLHFAWVWIRQDHRSGSTWLAAFEAVVAARFRRHALMLMQASAFEMIPADPPADETAITARQELMMRGYERLLGMQRISGYWGDRGWLWRPGTRLPQIPPSSVDPG